MLGIFGFGASASMPARRSAAAGQALPLLAWPALFGSLGWNFLEYGFTFEEDAIVWGWVIPGVIFIADGGRAAVWFVWSARSNAVSDERPVRAAGRARDGDGSGAIVRLGSVASPQRTPPSQ